MSFPYSPALHETLQKAEQFIAGFENDESQDPPVKQLLSNLRFHGKLAKASTIEACKARLLAAQNELADAELAARQLAPKCINCINCQPPTDIDRLMAEAFFYGRPVRSGAYHQGMRDTLAHRLASKPFPTHPFPQGSAEFDAYFAGVDEGRVIAVRVKTESAGAA